jgi:hypothetical protein
MESNKRNGNEISFVDGIEGRLGLVSFFGGYGLVGQPMLRKEKKRAPTSPTTPHLIQKDKLIEME